MAVWLCVAVHGGPSAIIHWSSCFVLGHPFLHSVVVRAWVSGPAEWHVHSCSVFSVYDLVNGLSVVLFDTKANRLPSSTDTLGSHQRSVAGVACSPIHPPLRYPPSGPHSFIQLCRTTNPDYSALGLSSQLQPHLKALGGSARSSVDLAISLQPVIGIARFPASVGRKPHPAFLAQL